MDLDRSALTTITRQPFSGSEIAQVASTLLVCAGLVLLLPAPVSSDRDTLTETGTTVCAERPDAPGNHQWTNGAVVEAPDSCDDEDDDDDGDDDSSGGPGQVIAASQRIPAHHNDASHVVQVDSDAHTFHPLDAHSLRGPPAGQKESSDADVDDDDDDDDSLGAHHSVLRAAAHRTPHSLSTVDAFHSAAIGSSQALRAPPQ
jgi:hypothetical protein